MPLSIQISHEYITWNLMVSKSVVTHCDQNLFRNFEDHWHGMFHLVLIDQAGQHQNTGESNLKSIMRNYLFRHYSSTARCLAWRGVQHNSQLALLSSDCTKSPVHDHFLMHKITISIALRHYSTLRSLRVIVSKPYVMTGNTHLSKTSHFELFRILLLNV